MHDVELTWAEDLMEKGRGAGLIDGKLGGPVVSTGGEVRSTSRRDDGEGAGHRIRQRT